MKVQRLDVGRMDAPERTPQGFLKVPAHLTRAGVFSYFNADGSERREYRPSSEVLRADSLATLISAPVTDQHPPEPVTVANREKYDRGHVGDNIVRDGGKVAATLYIKDGKLISSVERGDQREVSCGYTCDVEMTAGVVPDGEPDAGQRYDAIQRSITYNHVAAVPRGRAGSEVRMHLDSAGNQVMPRVDALAQEKPMSEKVRIERLDGVDYILDSDEHKTAVKYRADVAAAKAETAAAQAKADAGAAEVKDLKAKLEQASDPKRLDQIAAERAELIVNARKVLGSEAKLDGKLEGEIKREVVAKAYPEAKLEGRHDAYVEGLYEAAIAKTAESDLGFVRQRADVAETAPPAQRGDALAEYARAIEETEAAGRSMWMPK